MADPANGMRPIGPGTGPLGPGKAGEVKNGSPEVSFQDVLKDSIMEVNKLEGEASKAVNDLVTGKTSDMTEVMNAVKKSELAFTTLMEIRNKLVEAYDEVIRMRF